MGGLNNYALAVPVPNICFCYLPASADSDNPYRNDKALGMQ